MVPRTRPALLRAAAVAALAALVGAAALTVTTRLFLSDPEPTLAGRDSRCWRTKGSERAFAKRINKARGRSGRGKLRLDPELSKVARVHTKTMVRRNLLHHQPSTVLGRRVTRWRTLGENVGVGASVRSLHKAFMRSPTHRHNVLDPDFRYGGVGVLNKRGRMWVTVIFEASGNPGTRLRMPRC